MSPLLARSTEPSVAVCGVCGTRYTELGWGWLQDLGAQRCEDESHELELRRCGVPRCSNTLARPVLVGAARYWRRD